MASYVFLPITDLGLNISTDFNDDVFVVNASSDILIPGAIDPPKYSFLSFTTSKVVAVPNQQ